MSDHTYANIIRNLQTARSLDAIVDDAQKLVDTWRYDLDTRRPSPALVEDGVYKQPTDLDLATFLSALVERGAVIKIPKYASRRAATAKGNAVRLLDDRYGAMSSLVSNQKMFSFSLRLHDLSVLEDGKAGAFRTFMVVDVDGSWHDGFGSLTFMPDHKETAFIQKFMIGFEGKIVFDRFVHPMRWVSMFGRPYAASKLMIQALTRLAKNLRETKKQIGMVVTDPEAQKSSYDASSDSDAAEDARGSVEAIEVPNLLAEVTIGDTSMAAVALGQTSMGSKVSVDYPVTLGGLRAVTLALSDINKLVERLRFSTRLTEYAFFLLGDKREGQLPSWMSGQLWGREKDKRTEWNVIDLPHVSPDAKLRYRITTTKTQVKDQ